MVSLGQEFQKGSAARLWLDISYVVMDRWWLPWWLTSKESTCNAGATCRRRGFHPWVMKIPWRRKWQPAPVFLPGEFYGRRSLSGGYNLWGQKELDTIERPGSHARKKSSAVAVAVRG